MYLDNDIILDDMQYIYDRDIDFSLLDNKTILITGAYGMLSSYIVIYLMYLNKVHSFNIRVLAQGRNRDKAFSRFSEFWDDKRFEFVDFNISKEISYDQKVDYYIHSAGIANPKLYASNPVEVIEPNALGTYYLLEHAKKHGCKKFLLFSTGDIYGKVENPSEITETTTGMMDPLDIHSCYGESKRLAETLCMSFTKEYQVPCVMARIAHTYGPTMDIENDPRSFSAFMKCAVDGENIVMLSDGSAKRPFCYIADAVFAYLLILINGESGEAYNVSNAEQFLSILDVATTIANVTDGEISVIQKKRNDNFVENNLNICNQLTNTKLKKLGWECHYDITKGMRNTYEFFHCKK